MPTTLITGSNKGIGREVARQLADKGHDIWLAARDPEKGRGVAAELGVRFVALDVLDDDSVRAAAAAVAAAGGLDVLINNAGVRGPTKEPAETLAEDLATTFATNVLGVVRVTQAFLPLLLRSDAPAIVNVSSGMGSFALTSDLSRPESRWVSLPYSASKAALNMLTAQYARAFPQVAVVAVDPRFTATDFNQYRGTQTVDQGAAAIVSAADRQIELTSGSFIDAGGPVPW